MVYEGNITDENLEFGLVHAQYLGMTHFDDEAQRLSEVFRNLEHSQIL